MSELKNLPITQLQPNPWNRTVFDPQALDDLAASLKAEGVREPLHVRATGPDQYQISSGHRRWLAAQKAGLKEIPCLIETLSDDQVAEDNITLNIQREDIPPLELARMLDEYMKRYEKKQRQVAISFGKTEGWVSQYLGFLTLAPEIKNFTAVKFSMSDLRALKQLSPDLQAQVADELKAGILKVEGIQKRCNQLKFSKRSSKAASVESKVEEPPIVDPLEQEWDGIAARTPGWAWSQDYPSRACWTFEVHLESLLPEDLPNQNPKATLGQWFLAMAGALGATPQSKPEPQLQKIMQGNKIAAKAIESGDYTSMLQKIASGQLPTEEEQTKLAQDIARKYGGKL